MITIIVAALTVLVVIVVLVMSILVLRPETAAVIERRGRFLLVAEPGLNFLLPLIDRVRDRIDLREQVMSFPARQARTSDGHPVEAAAVVYFRVVDPRLASYETDNYIASVEQLTTQTLRDLIGERTLDDNLARRGRLPDELRWHLDRACARWGIAVGRVELSQLGTATQS